MNVLSVLFVLAAAVVVVREVAVGENESGSESEEARVEAEVDNAAGEGECEGENSDVDNVEYGDAGTVLDVDDTVRRWFVCDAEATVAATGLRPTAVVLDCGSGTADERRGRMAVSACCCQCCRLCSCLAVSSAIESMNANISTLRDRDDDGCEDINKEEVRWEWVVGRSEWVVVGIMLVVVVDEWIGGSGRPSLCSSVLVGRREAAVAA